MTASPKESPSVTSGLRVSFQPAKPAIPIRYLFSAYKMSTILCAPFSNRISHFKILAMP